MSIFNKIANYFRGYPRSDHGPVTPVGIGNRVMVDINGDLTYATCVNILSQAIAQCRWNIYDRASNAIPEASPGFKRFLTSGLILVLMPMTSGSIWSGNVSLWAMPSR